MTHDVSHASVCEPEQSKRYKMTTVERFRLALIPRSLEGILTKFQGILSCFFFCFWWQETKSDAVRTNRRVRGILTPPPLLQKKPLLLHASRIPTNPIPPAIVSCLHQRSYFLVI